MSELDATPAPPQRDLQRLMPVLVHLQARPEDNNGLADLARMSGLSEGHFHRHFKGLTGETPKQYALRLRLEHAAFRLIVFRSSILDTALACGFTSHETFTRAFKRRFGKTPRDYRAESRGHARPPTTTVPADYMGFEISETRIEVMESLSVAFIRHVGDYESITAEPWQRLQQWASRRGLESPMLLGIAHDAPGITPTEKLRFDLAMRLPAALPGEGEVGVQTLPGGHYGVTSHFGPYKTLAQAYRTAFQRLQQRKGYRLLGLPSIEIYRTTPINVDYAMHQTDICLPMEKR